ncbi:MAG: hypothetical protein U9O41_09610, partial [Candidatus Aerophobetes bacterium]|nr:hypothetical protein [Candidatus Aerophobetes bacterium]
LKDVERVYNLFKDDFYIDRNSILQAVQSQGLFNVIHNKFVVKVDFIIRKDTKYRKTEFNRRRKIYIEKTDIYIVSAEDLILSKLFWAKDFRSSTQLTDVRNILESVKNLDMNYLKFWVRELKLEEIFDEALG